MDILEIDYDKNVVIADYRGVIESFDPNSNARVWKIISNTENKFLLLEREENGVFHVAEADVRKKELFEVLEIGYRGPNGETFFFDQETGIDKI
jgi:hypothetical protein